MSIPTLDMSAHTVKRHKKEEKKYVVKNMQINSGKAFTDVLGGGDNCRNCIGLMLNSEREV